MGLYYFTRTRCKHLEDDIIAFLVVAASEEFVKSLGVYLYPFQQSFFDERMDGIIYGVMVAMGFAAVENVFYASQHDWVTVLVRAFTAVPTHAVFGVITGYYFGLAKFNKEKKWHYILRGLLIACLLYTSPSPRDATLSRMPSSA